MPTDDKDDGSSKGKKQKPPASIPKQVPAPTPKQVVVTHYGKKKPQTDVPSEILPTTPTHIIGSPVDIEINATLPQAGTTSVGAKSKSPEPPLSVSAKPGHPTFMEPALEDESLYSTDILSAIKPSQPPPRESEPVPPSSQGITPSQGVGTQAGSFALFVSLLSTAAVIALLGFAYFSQQQLNELQNASHNEKTSVQALAEQAKKYYTQIEILHNQHLVEQKNLEGLKEQLEHAQAHLIELSGSRDWVLSEANYLAFMANERLQVAQDIPTALIQLETAQKRLRMLGNPAFMGVQEALGKDIGKLQSFDGPNKQELWERIEALVPLLNQLNFKTPSYSEEKKPTTEQQKESTWRSALWRSWEEMKSLIRITRVDTNKIPLALSTQEQAQILRTLQLMFAQAQWAVLQKNSKIFLTSLQSISAWLQEYFVADQEQQILLKKINDLQQIQLDAPVPEISGTLNALSQALIEVSKTQNTASPVPRRE